MAGGPVNLIDDLGIHRLTLRFARSIEAEYAAERFERSVGQVRAGLLLAGLLIVAVLGILTAVDPDVDSYWRKPSLRLLAEWSVVPAVLGAWLLIRLRRSPGSMRLGTVIAIAWFFAVVAKDAAVGNAGYAQLSLMLVLALVFFTCIISNLDFVYCVPLAVLAVAVESALAMSQSQPFSVTQGMMYLTAGTAIALLGGYATELHARREFMLRRQVAAERERAEHLLLNVLPEPIARRLEAGAGTIADRFDQCSVLFGDVVGFTELASHLGPEDTVSFLSRVFTAFDELADLHGLEKIKTIGDAYMVVGGVPTAKADHATAIAEMALDMLDAVARVNQEDGLDLMIRIGIASGPVVAGVIGSRKFAYDLWGDTVNTASRMESHGIPGTIQVTEPVYRRLREGYEFQQRGEIEIKGKGSMTTYFLKGRRPAL